MDRSPAIGSPSRDVQIATAEVGKGKRVGEKGRVGGECLAIGPDHQYPYFDSTARNRDSGSTVITRRGFCLKRKGSRLLERRREQESQRRRQDGLKCTESRGWNASITFIRQECTFCHPPPLGTSEITESRNSRESSRFTSDTFSYYCWQIIEFRF